MQLNETIEFYTKASSMALKRMYNYVGSDYGITQTIGFVLVYIAKEGISPGKLSEKLEMKKSSLTRLLNKMEEEGCIYKKNDSDDKRITKLFLTEKGLERRRIAKVAVLGFNERIMTSVSDTELDAFIKVSKIITSEVDSIIEKK
ncbi:MAG: MarR family transcriptional regulator [Bacteroidetes bacterium]|nr:MAG: MarR family transcriptional regulator [Bacteroidota bacterium]